MTNRQLTIKKTVKHLTITLTVLLALIGVGGSIAFAAGYIDWAGTPYYENTKVNLDLIEQRGRTLITSLDDANDEIDRLDSVLIKKDNRIKELETQYAGTLRLAETEWNTLTSKVNNTNGMRNRYAALANDLNGYAAQAGFDARINDNPGQDTEDKELDQALEDMKDINERTKSVLEELGGTPE